MQSSNIPSKIPLPFGYAAGSGYINPIPAASQIGIVNGRASLHDGFPPDTFTPVTAGGVPPFGGDFNGILNEITSIQQWQEAGGGFPYDSAFASTIGGYPSGAILGSTSGAGSWLNQVDNNSSNPDAGGAGWVPSTSFYGGVIISLSSSNVTLTNSQAAYGIIYLQGTLTANCNIIFPTFTKPWIVVNSTSGSYTVQAKTASGTGINLTQGASTYIFGDGTNIQFADSAKVASFNGRVGTITLNSTDVTNALGFVPVQQGGGAGQGSNKIYLGWASNQLKVQVDATDQGALTFLNQFGSNWTTNGYQYLPNGFLMQWGSASGNPYNTFYFPITFPNACVAVTGSDNAGLHTFATVGVTQSYFILDSNSSSLSFYYFAIGY